MLRYHMAVITKDKVLKRAVQRLTAATGSTADFGGDASTIRTERPPHLAIYDARGKEPDETFLGRVPTGCRIMYIIEEDQLISRMPLLRDQRVTSLFCYGAQFDDDEFISSATKALRSEIFGLQKYFPWGVTSFSMMVTSYVEKRKAVEVLLAYAEAAGCRVPVRDRIQLVADELMMNGLYHSAVDKSGRELYAGKTTAELAKLTKVAPIQVRYACSGRYFGISVQDGGGTLTRLRALEYLLRAGSGGRIENKPTGAGLGLISVLHSVSKLVFNLEAGYSSEVVALFDMELFSQGKVGARSLHLFSAPPREEEEVEAPTTSAPVRTRRALTGNPGLWGVAAVMLAMVTALGTAAFMKRQPPSPAASRAVTVMAEPEDATVRLNGSVIPKGRPVPLPAEAAQPSEVTVQREGYATKSIAVPKDGNGRTHEIFHVTLARSERTEQR
ncbi:MAG: hypothetical protein IT371_04585 [Deltaproteobacteria bacterium]|nr:hypothetical protein [Deltaproteobacteria bacterium]